MPPQMPPLPDAPANETWGVCNEFHRLCLKGEYPSAIDRIAGEEYPEKKGVEEFLLPAAMRLYWGSIAGAIAGASRAGHVPVAKFLASRFDIPVPYGADLPADPPSEYTVMVARGLIESDIEHLNLGSALRVASTEGLLEDVEKVVEAIEALLSRAITKFTRKGRLDLAMYLIEMFRVPAADDWLGAAVKACDMEAIRYFAGLGCVLSYKDYSVGRDFEQACSKGDYDVVNFLIEQGCCTEILDYSKSDSYLYSNTLARSIIMACLGGHSDLAGVLYHKADDSDAFTMRVLDTLSKDWRPYRRNRRTDALMVLLEFLTSDGRAFSPERLAQAFSLACSWSDMPAFEFLLELGADPFADDQRELVTAAAEGNLDMVVHLLELGADLPAINDGTIAEAAKNGRTEVVNILLADPRVDPAARNSLAIRWASTYGHTEVVAALLVDDRSDPAAANNNALEMAKKRGHYKIVKLLEAALP